jgi:hypothetical protein
VDTVKYQTDLSEYELFTIGRMRATKKKAQVNNTNVFWVSILVTFGLIILLVNLTHNMYISLLGFSPLIGFYILTKRISNQIDRDAMQFVEQVRKNKVWNLSDKLDLSEPVMMELAAAPAKAAPGYFKSVCKVFGRRHPKT